MNNLENTYNFKIQLRRPNPALENEFYRVSLEEETARDFAKIKEKILELIPKIQKRAYVLTWTDADGDEVTIANNEALDIALNEMDGPVYK